MITRIAGLSRIALAAAACVLAGANVASAQSTTDSRWDTFLGCWTAADPGLTAKSTPIVCVTPTNAANAVQVATVRNDSIIGRDTIDATGTHKTVTKQGCSGWQNAEWSDDTRRVYLHSELTCAGGLKRTGTGLFAMAPTGEWLDVQSMIAGGNEGLRVNHYRMTETPAAVVAAIGANPLTGREMSASSQRTAAGGTITVGNIGEVVFKTDTAVTQAWIVERGTRFNLTSKDLLAMSNAGIPGSVSDVMVGISYPDHFALQEQQVGMMRGGSNMLSPRDSARIVADYLNDRCGSTYDPLWDMPGSFNSCGYSPLAYRGGYGYGYGYGYDSYGMGYSPYGYGYGGYGGYNGYGYPGGYYTSPVIVVKGDQSTQQPHGRVVNGRGYTRGTTSGSNGSGAPSTSYNPSTSSGSGSSSSTAPASSSSGSSSSGSSGGARTAIPRPPR
jgi:hypothetical protein